MKLRTLIFWCHLAAGITAGIVVLIMSLTGVLLMYERQMIERAEAVSVTPPAPDAKRLPMQVLLENARVANPDAQASALTSVADPRAPVALAFGREKIVQVDPYTGEVIGNGAPKLRAFFRFATDVHRWLAMKDEKRPIGKAITGACNLAFLFLIVSGFYLWWPRTWSRRAVKSVMTFGSGLKGRARDWNWHNVIGFWCAIPLFLLVFTATFFSYPWTTRALYKLTGNEPPPPRPPSATARSTSPAPGNRQSQAGAPAHPAVPENLDALWATAAQQMEGWQSISLRLPMSPDGTLSFTILGGHRGRPDKRASLVLDSATGEIRKWETFSDGNSAQKIRAWVRWIHTGEAGGFFGQTLAGLASAGAVVLVWTGFALSWRRFFGRRTVTKDSNNAPATPDAPGPSGRERLAVNSER